MHVSKTFEITDQMIEDLFVTAIEGGIDYWGYFSPVIYSRLKNDYPTIQSFSERVYHAIMVVGCSLPIRDVETDEVWHFNKASVERALEIMANDHEEDFMNIVDGNFDAITADVFFQLVAIGELTFG
jgi:hypothetical protein